MAQEHFTTHRPPEGYRKLAIGVRCPCTNLYQIGSEFYCCNEGPIPPEAAVPQPQRMPITLEQRAACIADTANGAARGALRRQRVYDAALKMLTELRQELKG